MDTIFKGNTWTENWALTNSTAPTLNLKELLYLFKLDVDKMTEEDKARAKAIEDI